MLALDDNPEHLILAKEIGYTCWQFYERNPTGIAPEIAGFDPTQVHHRKTKDFFNQAPHYLLRPETVESFMILYRVTGDKKYKEWGWKVFQSLETHCKVEGGYSGIRDVGQVPVRHDDRYDDLKLMHLQCLCSMVCLNFLGWSHSLWRKHSSICICYSRQNPSLV